MIKLDFLRDSEGKLVVVDGDFQIGNATAQHANIILNANKGELRLTPQVGIGLNNFIGSPSTIFYDLEQYIKKELQKESIFVKSMVFDYTGNNVLNKIEVE